MTKMICVIFMTLRVARSTVPAWNHPVLRGRGLRLHVLRPEELGSREPG